MRISFVGGGTDLPDFYRRSPGRVISTAINQFVSIVVHRTPYVDKISARYSLSETVDRPHDLEHPIIRAALLDLGINKGIEIASFGSLSAKMGLGSSSSFSVALLKGLHAFQGKKLDRAEVAEAACRLEIDLLNQPIGKQDQYAAAFGGFNIFQFNPDGTVDVEPILLDYQKRSALEKHILLFFTGLTRSAAAVLSEQRSNIDAKFGTLQKMAESVYEFKEQLLKGNWPVLGAMLHEGWQQKRSLASTISNSVIDQLYLKGMEAGAWGGKVLGAGGGGCVMFLADPERQEYIKQAVSVVARDNHLEDFRHISVKFVQSGAEVLFNGDGHFNSHLI
ncbi:MAG: GHMP kinase [bacterium]|nr:GHMP kinase [bacterium]